MGNIGWILSGGFAKGYRTYVMASVVVITALAAYAVGDAGLIQTIQIVAGGTGLGALRAAVG
jgi:hypothetical protein